MKLLTSLFAFIPGLVFAANSIIHCTTPGTPRLLNITISSEQSLLEETGKLTVHAKGMFSTTYQFTFTQLEASTPNQILLAIVEDRVLEDPLPPFEGLVEGEITLNRTDIPHLPGVVLTAASAQIHLTEFPEFSNLREIYELSNCTGVIKL
jgi:hypothetical protein